MSDKHARTLPWVLAALPLLGFWTYGLFDLDEGFYGAVVSAMLRDGDWITPHYAGDPWFEKPILLYWAAAPFAAALGSDWALRVPSVLATLGAYAIAAASVRRHAGELAGRWTVVVLGTSLIFAAVGRMMMTDALLVLTLGAAFLAHWEARGGEPRWRLATAACLGLAVLAKGPVALMLFLPVAGIAAWLDPDLRVGFWRGWLSGVLVLSAVVALWYVPAYLASGQRFVQEFLIEQNVQRFVGGDAAHSTMSFWQGLPLYPVVLLLGMAPWSFFAFRAFCGRPFERYLGVWFFVVLAFFTVGGSKLPHYILPAALPLAMLVAIRFGKAERRIGWGAAATSAVVFGVLNLGFVLYYGAGHSEVHALARLVPAGQRVVSYQMPRRSEETAAAKPGVHEADAEPAPEGPLERLMEKLSKSVNETSHPSLEFYLDRVVGEGETLADIEAAAPAWVITRKGRLSEVDLRRMRRDGFFLSPRTPEGIRHYRLFEVVPLRGADLR